MARTGATSTGDDGVAFVRGVGALRTVAAATCVATSGATTMVDFARVFVLAADFVAVVFFVVFFATTFVADLAAVGVATFAVTFFVTFFVTFAATFFVTFAATFFVTFAAAFFTVGFAGVRADRTSTTSPASELAGRDDALRFLVDFAESGLEGGVSAAIWKRGKDELRTLSARNGSTSMRGVRRVRAHGRIAWLKPCGRPSAHTRLSANGPSERCVRGSTGARRSPMTHTSINFHHSCLVSASERMPSTCVVKQTIVMLSSVTATNLARQLNCDARSNACVVHQHRKIARETPPLRGASNGVK